MKNQFSTLLKEVISLSREEAVRLNSEAIGTGHLLLALIRQDHRMTILLLKKADITLQELQKEIDIRVVFPATSKWPSAEPEGGKSHTGRRFGSKAYAQPAG